jgi:hypothetical protein
VENQHYYFRVITAPDGTQTLMGQQPGASPFDGRIHLLQAEGSGYSRHKEIRLPRNTSVLALAKGPVTRESQEDYVMINQFGRLVVAYDSGSPEWKSTDNYGGTAHVWLMPKKEVDASMRDRIYLHPRLLFHDMNGNGMPEILAVKNNEFGGGAFGRYKRFKNGSIQVLSWNGISLAPLFVTTDHQGWISDFTIVDPGWERQRRSRCFGGDAVRCGDFEPEPGDQYYRYELE